MEDFEIPSSFYLGREYDLDARAQQKDLVLYDARDLTTHAVCVGMTGSGKTGLCVALLEEAAIDGIPAIVIDPKGDLANLLLAFPDLRPEDFRPWVDPAEADRQGIPAEQLAEQTAREWRTGLEEWGQTGARIGRFREAAEAVIYTPGGAAGIPLTVLRSFVAPPARILEDGDALRERVNAAVSGLLALLGIDADPIRSREHILLANLVERAWRERRDLDLGGLIREIQSPRFDKIGVMDLESIFPSKERVALAMTLNNLLASPGFAAWMQGEPLDVQKLLYGAGGHPRLSIISIAHLSESERMFFVTILLNEVVAWMRSQPGTSSLRALIYMDEVFGYFPPSANPPAKTPMLTLLKQARAYGLGVVLATQNPVDLDYKGLSNAGTWFIGRLQTERDKARVLDGLEGASAAAGSTLDRGKMDRILSGLGKRVFLMNNVHEDRPVVFQSRWALSYLRGPLSREQIQTLMAARKAGAKPPATVGAAATTGSTAAPPQAEAPAPVAAPVGSVQRPLLPPEFPEFFIPCRKSPAPGTPVKYLPALMGSARVHFANAKSNVDVWESLALLASIDETMPDHVWESAEVSKDGAPDLEKSPSPGTCTFAGLPSELSRPKKVAELTNALKDVLYRAQTLEIWRCPSLKQISRPGESEADFRIRLSQAARQDRDQKIEKLRAKYAPKVALLEDRIRRAQQKVEKEKSQASQQMFQTALSVGSSLLGALVGRKLASVGNVGRAASAARSAGRVTRENQDVTQATENVAALESQRAELDVQFKAEADALQDSVSPDKLALEQIVIKPKKADINVTRVALVWRPFAARPDGTLEALY